MTNTIPPAPEDGAAARRLAMAQRLAEIGMALAEDLLVRSKADDAPAPEAMALAYGRVARAVRLSLALAERLEAGEPADGRGVGEPVMSEPVRAGLAQKVKARLRFLVRREEVGQLAGLAIAAAARERLVEAPEVEPLYERLAQRLAEAEQDDATWRERPLGELAARVCADLGVAYDPELWACEAPAADDGEDEDDQGEEADDDPPLARRPAGRRRVLAEGP